MASISELLNTTIAGLRSASTCGTKSLPINLAESKNKNPKYSFFISITMTMRKFASHTTLPIFMRRMVTAPRLVLRREGDIFLLHLAGESAVWLDGLTYRIQVGEPTRGWFFLFRPWEEAAGVVLICLMLFEESARKFSRSGAAVA